MDIPLGILEAAYKTDQGTSLILFRPYATLGFPDRAGRLVHVRCLIDTGSPLSVVPYDVWKHRNLDWTSVSKTLHGQSRISALKWQGVSCDLGRARVDLFGARKLEAKFALGPAAPIDIILGLNFLVDNDLEIHLQGAAAKLSGNLTLPE